METSKKKERPATKKSITEVLEEIKRGHELAEEFAKRCQPTRELLQKRVVV